MIDACIAHVDKVLMEPKKDPYSQRNRTILRAMVPELGAKLKYFFKEK